MQNDPGRSAPVQPDAKKAAYICSVKKRLVYKRTVLERVKRNIDRAVTSGRIVRSDQLANAERRADSSLSEVKNCIEHLCTGSNSSWDNLRIKTDTAFDEFSTAVKQMVARFT